MALERRSKAEYQRFIIKKIKSYKQSTTLPMPIKILRERTGYTKSWLSRALRTMIDEGLVYKPDWGSVDLLVDK